MNRNYKVIWNRSLGCFTAVAEYAKSRGKSSNNAVSSTATASAAISAGARLLRLSGMTVALAATGLTLSTQVYAAQGILGGSGSGDFVVAVPPLIGLLPVPPSSSTVISPQTTVLGLDILGAEIVVLPGCDIGEARIDGATSTNSTAIGCGTAITDSADTVAIGRENKVTNANGSTALGNSNIITNATNAVAIGSSNTVAASDAVAIGNNVSIAAGLNGAVGIGNNTTVTASSVPSFAPTDATVAGETVGSNVVSIGSTGNERRLTNVAAGGADTDAVNVSQLKGVDANVTTNTNNIANLTTTVTAQKPKYVSINSTGGTNENNDGATGVDAIAIGKNAQSSLEGATAVGRDANADGFSTVAVGDNSTANTVGDVAIGINSIATGGGRDNIGAVALGADSRALGNGNIAIGDNSSSTGGNRATALGSNAATIGSRTTALGFNSDAIGTGATALGDAARAEGEFATAIRGRALADSAIAVGGQALADSAIAVGGQALAENAIALGGTVTVRATNSVSIGQGSEANGTTLSTAAYQPLDVGGSPISVALPTAAAEVNIGNRRLTGLAAGATDTDAVNVSQLKGVNANVITNTTNLNNLTTGVTGIVRQDTGTGAITVGAQTPGTSVSFANSTDDARNVSGVADGDISVGSTDAVNGDQLNATNTSITNLTTTVSGIDFPIRSSSTQPFTTTATGTGALAVGANASAINSNSTAIGETASATGSESTALGSASQAFADSATAVGFGARADQYGATALGVSSRAQGQYSSAFGQQASAVGDRSVAIGKDASTSALASSAVAMGDGASATNQSATALGVNAQALGARSVALGEGAKATTLTGTAIGSRTLASAVQSTAVGVGSKATKQWAAAVGFSSEANGVSSVALGDRSVVDGNESIAIGSSNTVAARNAVAIGNNIAISTGLDGAVGIGNGTTVTGSSVASFAPTGATVVGTTTGSNVVSVGTAGNERRLTNVAAGGADTDAVNVSQLKGVDTNLNNLTTGVTGIVRQDTGTGAITVGAQTNGTSVSFTGIDGNRQITGVTSAGNITLASNANNAATAGDVNTAIEGVTAAGLNFVGDDNTVIDRNLGQTLSVTGNATGNLTDGNIGVVADGTEGLSVQLAENIDLGVNGSVTTGNTVTNNTGVTITDSTNTAIKTTITTAGTNVTDDNGNTGNYGAATTVLTDDSGNTNASAAFGNAILDDSGNANLSAAIGNAIFDDSGNVNLSGAEGNVIFDDSDNITTTSATGTNVTDGINTSDYGADGFTATNITTNTSTIFNQSGVSFLDDQGIATGPSITATGIDAGDLVVSNVADGVLASDAANIGQVDAAVTGVTELGFNITADNSDLANNETEDNVQLGETVDFTNTDGNLVATVSDNGINYDLAENIDLGVNGSVTTGNTVTNNTGVTITDSTNTAIKTTITTAGTNVTDGTNTADYGAEGLFATNGNGETGIYDADGSTIYDNSGNTTITSATGTDVTDDAGNNSNYGAEGLFATDGLGNSTIVNQAGVSFTDTNDVQTGPSVTAAGIDAGMTQITGVASAGDITNIANANNAANAGDVNAAITGVTELGLTFAGDSGNDVQRNLGQTLNITGGATGNLTTGNIGVVANGADGLSVQLAEAIDLGADGSVRVGNTNVNNAGITILNGPVDTVTLGRAGLNNGGNRITNVADGVVSNDAATFGQVEAVDDKVDMLGDNTATNLGGGAVYNAADGSVSAPTYTLDDGNNAGTTANFNNVGDALGNLDGRTTTNTSNIAMIQAQANQGFNISAAGGADDNVQLGQTVDFTNTDGNLVVTNDADNGINYDLAENIDLGATGSVTTGDTVVNNAGVAVDDGAGNATTITTGGTNVVDSSGNSADYTAIGSTLADGNDNTNVSTATGNTIDDGNGNVTSITGAGTSVTDGTNTSNYGANGFTATDGTTSTVFNQAGVTFLGAGGAPVGPSVTAAGFNAGGTVITNVADGVAATDAATKGQVDAVSDGLADLTAGAVQYDTNPDGTVNKDSITLGGDAGTTITNVSGGAINADSTDAINGSQLYDLGNDVAGIIGGNAAIDADGNLTASDIGGTGANNINDAIATVNNANAQANEDIQANTDRLDTGLSFGADNGDNVNKSVGDSTALQFEGSDNITTTTTESGIQFDLSGNISVDSVTADTVTTGNTTVNTNGVTIANGPSMTTEGINAGGKTITGVADGLNPTDAVNFGQLSALDGKLSNSVNELGYKINEVEDDANAGISAAMAMSSLPQAYIPGKSMVGGGVATYNGESAVAIGVSKVSDNGRWVMKINGTADTQGNAGGAIGAGFHF